MVSEAGYDALAVSLIKEARLCVCTDGGCRYIQSVWYAPSDTKHSPVLAASTE